MWLYTVNGFLSVVAFDPKKDSVKRSKREVKGWGAKPKLVRARVRDDLEQLRPYWSKLKIEADDSADYKYRAIVPVARLKEFMMNCPDEIDYDSHVKETITARAPKAEHRYEGLTGAWNAFSKLQDTPPYWGIDWTDYRRYGTSKYSTTTSNYGGGKYESGKGWTWDNDADAGSYRSLCTANITTYGSNETYKQWCVLDSGHGGAHDYRSARAIVDVKDDGWEPYKPIYSDPADSTETPDTVEDMCRALLKRAPGDIYVDEATKYSTYDLWARALEEYKRPLDASEILSILDELSEDNWTTEEARNNYRAALDKFSAEMFIDQDEAQEDTNPLDISDEDLAPYVNFIGKLKEDDRLNEEYDRLLCKLDRGTITQSEYKQICEIEKEIYGWENHPGEDLPEAGLSVFKTPETTGVDAAWAD